MITLIDVMIAPISVVCAYKAAIIPIFFEYGCFVSITAKAGHLFILLVQSLHQSV